MSNKHDLTELTALAQLAYAYVQLATPIKVNQIKQLTDFANKRNNPNNKFKLTRNKDLLNRDNLNSFNQLFCVLNKPYVGIKDENFNRCKQLFNISRAIIIVNLNGNDAKEFDTGYCDENQLDNFIKTEINKLFETDIFLNTNVESFNNNLTAYFQTSEFQVRLNKSLINVNVDDKVAAKYSKPGDNNSLLSPKSVQNTPLSGDTVTQSNLNDASTQQPTQPSTGDTATQSNNDPQKQPSDGDANNKTAAAADIKTAAADINTAAADKKIKAADKKIKAVNKKTKAVDVNEVRKNRLKGEISKLQTELSHFAGLNDHFEGTKNTLQTKIEQLKAELKTIPKPEMGGTRKLKKVKSKRRSKSFKSKKYKRTHRINL
jgi:hypothetical protein